MRLAFSEVVGQDAPKTTLLLAASRPLLGGVLLRGDKGSAKTTLARGLAALLPGEAPFIELPLGASEDRVIGSLDLGVLLGSGHPTFRPGLLAAAHGGVLYVDEINLLPDHLVDTLLDVAVSGVNTVERDGVSHRHPARFVLVASMNPEEGELRPQLLDRFGLAVEVRAPNDAATRAAIVRAQINAETRSASVSPSTNTSSPHVTPGDRDLRAAIERSLDVHPTMSDRLVSLAAHLALEVGAEGMRADLMLCRAATAHAALDERHEVSESDLAAVAAFVLAHRRRRRPFDPPSLTQEELEAAWQRALDALDSHQPPAQPHHGPAVDQTEQPEVRTGSDAAQQESSDGTPPSPGSPGGAGPLSPQSAHGGVHTSDSDGYNDSGRQRDRSDSNPGSSSEQGAEVPTAQDSLELPADEPNSMLQSQMRVRIPVGVLPRTPALGTSTASRSIGSATRSTADPTARRGAVVREQIFSPNTSMRIDARATATVVATRRAITGEPTAAVSASDLRSVARSRADGLTTVLVVDASGSMGVEHRMAATKAAVIGLLSDAYIRRDRVALITFAGDSADVVLRPTGSVELARARLAGVRTGGTTPLAAGIRAARQLASTLHANVRIVLVTDGRATASTPGTNALDEAASELNLLTAHTPDVVVVDTETGARPLGFAKQLADHVGARHFRLDGDFSVGLEAALRNH